METPHPVQIGSPAWSPSDMRASIDEFLALHAQRPVRDNIGGMLAPHQFLLWFALRRLQPRTVIESGIWMGQGTWWIEKACDADIICLDPVLSRLKYRSPRATYSTTDFSRQSFDCDPETTVLVFDDHQNAVERVKQSREKGFRHLLFDDNYPTVDSADCYTIKLALDEAGWHPERTLKNAVKGFLGRLPDAVKPNSEDARWLRSVLEIYSEMPPVVRPERTRWGTEMPATVEALFAPEDAPELFRTEADAYTWMCYLRLRRTESQ